MKSLIINLMQNRYIHFSFDKV